MFCMTKGGLGVQPPEAGFKMVYKIGTKHLKNTKINNADLYFQRLFVQQGEHS